MGLRRGELRARIEAVPGGAEAERLSGQLAAWLEALLDAPLNLTAARDAETAAAKHAVEPLAAWRAVRGAVELPDGPLIDVGSGNGAPGLPIALAEAPRPATLLDGKARAAEFLRGMPELLDAPQISVVEERAEEAARGGLREQFAAAVTRAAAKPEIVLELLLPFLREGGIGVAFVGGGTDRAALQRAAAELGGELLDEPPDEGLVVVRKRRPTPEKYPRRWASMRRRPIASPVLEPIVGTQADPSMAGFQARRAAVPLQRER